MREALLIGLAGMCGAVLRTSIGVWMNEAEAFPFGTYTANMIATWVLFLFAAGVLPTVLKSKELRDMVTVGFLGSFSTFSAFSIETVLLVENDQVMLAVIYVFTSLIGGLVVGRFGFYVGGKWNKT